MSIKGVFHNFGKTSWQLGYAISGKRIEKIRPDNAVAFYHTHPEINNLSEGDRYWAYSSYNGNTMTAYRIYGGFPNGKISVFDPMTIPQMYYNDIPFNPYSSQYDRQVP